MYVFKGDSQIDLVHNEAQLAFTAQLYLNGITRFEPRKGWRVAKYLSVVVLPPIALIPVEAPTSAPIMQTETTTTLSGSLREEGKRTCAYPYHDIRLGLFDLVSPLARCAGFPHLIVGCRCKCNTFAYLGVGESDEYRKGLVTCSAHYKCGAVGFAGQKGGPAERLGAPCWHID